MLPWLLLLVPVFDPFDAPLDPARWFVGVPSDPVAGELRIPRGGWIVARGLPDDGFARLEVDLGEGGGELEITFHDGADPLGAAVGEPVRARAKERPTVATAAPKGAFRLHAVSGDVVVREVRVDAEPKPPRFSELERRTLFGVTTPGRLGDARRVELPLWDVEIAILARRGKEPSCEFVRAPVKGAPALAALVTITDGTALARKASGSKLAAREWADERRNLVESEFERFLAAEYALLETLETLQRAMNGATAPREGLDAIVALAPIRHADVAHAALALAETRGAKSALHALRKAAGPHGDPAQLSGDQLREAAARAAEELLGPVPSEWRGFRIDTAGRHAALQRTRDVIR